MSKSLRRFSLAAALLFVATACGEERKSITDPSDVGIVAVKKHSLEDIDPNTGSPFSIYGDQGGSNLRASSVLSSDNFDTFKGTTASLVAEGLGFEDLPDATAQHAMSGHNPYHGVTFSANLWHWSQTGYGQAHSGKVFLYNAFGVADEFVSYPDPTIFRGVWASEPHNDGSQLIMDGYNGATKVWTVTSPTLTATTQFVPINNTTPITKVVFNTQRHGNDWYVLDDINGTPVNDNSPPQITPILTGQLGSNGWYIGPVTVTWQVVDNESAITSPPCATVVVTNNTNGQTFNCTATSAGGTSSMSTFVKKDDTPPVVNPVATGTVGNNGWFKAGPTPLIVTFNPQEDISGFGTLTGCGNQPVNNDTPGITFTCTATNQAGLTTTKSITVKRDTQQPIVNFTTTGNQGGNGWFTTDVTVNWQIQDAMSGVGTAIGCDPYTQTTDTPLVALVCTVTDNAGNSQFRPFNLKRDASFATITKSVTGTLGDDDWFTSDAVLSWTVTANGPSGLTSAQCPSVTINQNTPGMLFICKAVTGAGKFNQLQANIKRDDESPTVNAVPNGTMGADGWFTSDVAVGWMVIPNGPSGASAAGCNVTTVSTNTPGTTIECIAKSGAGIPGHGTITVKRDASTPTVAPSLAGSLGDNGWFTSNVDVSWSVTPNGPSGANAMCNVYTVTGDTPGEIVGCTATSGAGLSATEKVTVKKDASSPTLTSSLSGTLGANGWYTSDVDVSWQASANGPSGASVACGTQTLSTNSAGTTFDCSAKSGAGVKTPGSVTVKRDASTATVTPVVTGDLGANGWYTSDVQVSWGVTANGPSGASVDATSGPACAVSSLSTDTQGVTYDCTATTGAGKTSSNSVTVKRDASGPSVDATIVGTLGTNGWYRSDVDVSWATADAISGISSSTGCSATSLAADGSQSYTCSATNGAGKSNSKTVDVKRDATDPAIGYTGNAGTYTVDQNVSISCTASDATSGLAVNTCAPISGPAYSFGSGATFTANAKDNAGNTNSATTSFTVKGTSASLCALTKLFVTGPGEAGIENSMCTKLDKRNYAPYINEVRAQSGKSITVGNANILIAIASSM